MLAFAASAMASNQTTQSVSYSVSAINEIGASGDPAALSVTTCAAGSDPAEVTNALTTYSFSTNGTNKKITAALNSNVASGLTLKINMAAPPSGVSAGDVTLTTDAANAVTSIDTEAASAKTITYKFSATMAAGVISSTSKTVTLTLTDG